VKAKKTTTKNPTSTGMARSDPGQWTPALADPEDPKLVNMTPTTVLMVFSGTLAQLARDHHAHDGHEDGGYGRRQRGEAEPVLGRAEADDDQHHLGALEEDTLEGHGEADAVAAAGALVLGGLLTEFGPLSRRT